MAHYQQISDQLIVPHSGEKTDRLVAQLRSKQDRHR
jgi:hypothetical protein